ncbi:MAG: hypothetical protein H7Y11_03890, partial [Armatimonadetes bacterium]|nr:hypothetical protein [Anaerolineae bacterium]
RVVNAAAVAGDVPTVTDETDTVAVAARDLALRDFDVLLDDQVIAQDISVKSASGFVGVAPGEYTLMFSPVETTVEAAAVPLTLVAGQVVSAVVTDDGLGGLVIDTIPEDLDAVLDRRSGRVTIYNGFTETVSVVTIESELFDDARKVNAVAADIPVGASTSLVLPEGALEWVVIRAGTEQVVRDTLDEEAILGRTSDVRLERDTTQMVVLTSIRQPDGVLGLQIYAGGDLVTQASAEFGSPVAVGQTLFIQYLLPFQMVAILLLAAMVGVIVLTLRGEEHVPKPSRATRRKVSRPLTSVIASQTGSDLMEDTDTETPRLPEALPIPVDDPQPEPAGD